MGLWLKSDEAFAFPYFLNPLPNDKILALSKLKTFADYGMNETKMMIYPFDRPENIVRKGENAGNQHFLLLPHGFPKPFSSGVLKVGIVW